MIRWRALVLGALLSSASTGSLADALAAQAAPDTLPSDSGGAATQIVTIRVEQARQLGRTLRAFVYAHDESGAAMARALSAPSIMASVGSHVVHVDRVRAFRPQSDGTAVLFLVDVSRSLSADQFEQMRRAIVAWRRRLGPGDRAALITFGAEVRLVSGFAADSTEFLRVLEAIESRDDQTRFYEAVIRAQELAQQSDTTLPDRRVVVMLSDGVDDALGGPTRQEALQALSEGAVPIYGIGFAAAPIDAAERAGLQTLGEFARTSGGAYIDGSAPPLSEVFARIHDQINAAHVVDLDCSACPNDGKVYRLTLNVGADSRQVTHGVDVRLFAVANPSAAGARGNRLMWIAGVIAFLVVSGIVIAWIRVRARNEIAVAGAARSAIVADPVPAARATVSHVPTSRVSPIQIKVTPLAPGMPQDSRVLMLAERTTLGRDPQRAEVAFRNETSMSAVHCALSRQGDRVFVEDLQSTNGTFVNGVPVHGRHLVHSDDVIRLGQFEVRLRMIADR